LLGLRLSGRCRRGRNGTDGLRGADRFGRAFAGRLPNGRQIDSWGAIG
jgi:hypothetical protein